MQICNKCQKKIRYIPITNNKLVCCDEEEKIAYTYTGRELKVYILHECTGEKNEKNNDDEQKSIN